MNSVYWAALRSPPALRQSREDPRDGRRKRTLHANVSPLAPAAPRETPRDRDARRDAHLVTLLITPRGEAPCVRGELGTSRTRGAASACGRSGARGRALGRCGPLPESALLRPSRQRRASP